MTRYIANFGHLFVGAVVAFLVGNFVRRWLPQTLTTLDLTPGAWFCYYVGDWITDHNGGDCSSAPVQMDDGTFIWATDTPEWDQEWFEDHGWEFPEKWVTFANLADLQLERMNL